MAYAKSRLKSDKIKGIFDRKKLSRCKKCKDEMPDGKYFNCIGCRLAAALRHMLWRHDHIERKLCTECCDGSQFRVRMLEGQRKKGRMRKCQHHHEYHLAYKKHWRLKQQQTVKAFKFKKAA